MLRSKWVATLAMGTLVALPALAGEGEKCTASTQECLNYMANKMRNSGWVGVELDSSAEGALVVNKVIEGSPAEKAGIKPGDILFAVNGLEYNDANMQKLGEMKAASKPGDDVVWTVKRNGSSKELTITLARMPADLLARYIGQHMLEHAAVEVAENN
jgi:C-terminal processing protease CtpA/Prc